MMGKFLCKSESRGIKIDRVNSIRIIKSSIYFNLDKIINLIRAVPLSHVIKRTRFLISSRINQFTRVATVNILIADKEK